MLRRISPVVLVVLAACSASAAPLAPADTTSTTTTTVANSTSTTTSSTTTTTRPTTTTTVLSTASLAPGQSLAARSDGELGVFASAGDAEPMFTLESATILGTPRVVRVIEGPDEGWMRVSLPVRPNGSEGWIRADDVTLFVLDRRVEVDLSDRRLEVIGPGGTLLETTVAVGSSSSPTPVGSFFVTDSVIVGNPSGPWGPWAFGLSAYSDVVTEFNGGNGIIGIHGTNRPGSIGYAQSLGCVRVPNDVALELGELISAGVPVEIAP